MSYDFNTPWHAQNLAAIRQRLAPFLQQQNLAKIIPSEVQGVFVRTIDEIVELYCYDPESRDLSDIMSRVGIKNPLELIATYNQVLFLSFVWQHALPERIYIAGFGGGRLGMVSHHYSPEVEIHGSDFDPAIVDVAESHFGIEYDSRYSIKAADSGEDFDSRNTIYDTIIIDVFSSSGIHASHLASQPFFKLCNSKLKDDGVLAINLIERDPEREAKISNLASVFPHLIEWRNQGSHLIFASKQEPNLKTWIKRAEEFESAAALTYPFSEHAKALTAVDREEYKVG